MRYLVFRPPANVSQTNLQPRQAPAKTSVAQYFRPGVHGIGLRGRAWNQYQRCRNGPVYDCEFTRRFSGSGGIADTRKLRTTRVPGMVRYRALYLYGIEFEVGSDDSSESW